MTNPVAFGDITVHPADSTDQPRAMVLVLPAISTPTTAYRHVVTALSDEHITTATMSYGTNTATPAKGAAHKPGTFAYLADYAIPAALRDMRAAADGRPVWILAHSLGAQVAVLAAQRQNLDVDGMCFVAGGSPYYRHFPTSTELLSRPVDEVVSGSLLLVG